MKGKRSAIKTNSLSIQIDYKYGKVKNHYTRQSSINTFLYNESSRKLDDFVSQALIMVLTLCPKMIAADRIIKLSKVFFFLLILSEKSFEFR